GHHNRRWTILIGLLLGLSVVAEYTSALPAIVIGAYLVLSGVRPVTDRIRTAGLLLAGALPAALFLGWYHLACFGGVLETGYRHLADVGYQPWHEGGFLGIKTPTWHAFVGSFFSPLRGLFALSPFLLVALVGIRRCWKQRNTYGEFGGIALFSAVLF